MWVNGAIIKTQRAKLLPHKLAATGRTMCFLSVRKKALLCLWNMWTHGRKCQTNEWWFGFSLTPLWPENNGNRFCFWHNEEALHVCFYFQQLARKALLPRWRRLLAWRIGMKYSMLSIFAEQIWGKITAHPLQHATWKEKGSVCWCKKFFFLAYVNVGIIR